METKTTSFPCSAVATVVYEENRKFGMYKWQTRSSDKVCLVNVNSNLNKPINGDLGNVKPHLKATPVHEFPSKRGTTT